MSNHAEIRFMWTVQALALPAMEQEGLFPDFVMVGDELALDHDEARRVYLEVVGEGLSASQRAAIESLDRQLEQMSGLNDELLWEIEAVATAAEWSRVRELAAHVLRELGWPLETPPLGRAIYVGPPS